MRKVVLAIAGSDPSAGAGIQADLKSFSFLGLHGVTVITCITSQNTQTVRKIHKLPIEIIESQIDTIFEDFKISAVKTGMLFDGEIIKLVSKKILQYNLKPIVDPVMVSTSGKSLSNSKSIFNDFKEYLLPNALIVTANIPEAIELSGTEINSIDDVKNSCKKISTFGPEYVLIKGGHLKNKNCTDILYDRKNFYDFTLPRISNKKAHGSGCTLSALITGLIALNETPIQAVKKAKFVVWDMIKKGYAPAKGSDVLNHSISIKVPPKLESDNYYKVWFELKNSVYKLINILPSDFIPEVGVNFAYAPKNATKLKDICAIDGRIVLNHSKISVCGNINFGVSKHVSAIVLAVMSIDKNYRSAMNIKFSEKNLKLCKKSGLKIGSFDRTFEPKTSDSTMEWGTKKAIKKLGFIPDIIYDLGGVGKEPMIRIIGKNPDEVISKIIKIIKPYNNKIRNVYKQ